MLMDKYGIKQLAGTKFYGNNESKVAQSMTMVVGSFLFQEGVIKNTGVNYPSLFKFSTLLAV